MSHHCRTIPSSNGCPDLVVNVIAGDETDVPMRVHSIDSSEDVSTTDTVSDVTKEGFSSTIIPASTNISGGGDQRLPSGGPPMHAPPQMAIRPLKTQSSGYRKSKLRFSVGAEGADPAKLDTEKTSGGTAQPFWPESSTSQQPPSKPAPEDPAKARLANLKIAFVDDDPANQRVGVRFLKALGVQPANIVVMGDGE